MNRTPFCTVFNVCSPYRIESRNLASLVALGGLLTAEPDTDIGRLRVIERDGGAKRTARAISGELDETIEQNKADWRKH